MRFLHKKSNGHELIMLLRHNITGTESASSASIMHSNPAKLNPVSAVLHGRRVAKTSPALCIKAAWVKFCLNCSTANRNPLWPQHQYLVLIRAESHLCAYRGIWCGQYAGNILPANFEYLYILNELINEMMQDTIIPKTYHE